MSQSTTSSTGSRHSIHGSRQGIARCVTRRLVNNHRERERDRDRGSERVARCVACGKTKTTRPDSKAQLLLVAFLVGVAQDCLRHLMSLKYKEYLEKVKAADCGRSLRNMLSQGPPLFIRDSTALPTNTEEDDSDSSDTTKADQPDSAADDSTTSTTTSSSTSPKPTASSTQMDVDRALSTANEVKELWFASSKSVEPAKVDHALEGTERLKLWRQLIVDNKDRLDNKGGLDALEARLQQLLEGDDKSVK